MEHSSFGKISVLANDQRLIAINLGAGNQDLFSNDISQLAIDQLDEYFKGERKIFDLPIELSHHGAFNQSVWEQLLSIPYGSTISYKSLANKIGKPKASRAVGLANGKNPLPIVVPCHRVIGSNGRLTGYALGLDMKQKLLQIEGAIKQQSLFN